MPLTTHNAHRQVRRSHLHTNDFGPINISRIPHHHQSQSHQPTHSAVELERILRSHIERLAGVLETSTDDLAETSIALQDLNAALGALEKVHILDRSPLPPTPSGSSASVIQRKDASTITDSLSAIPVRQSEWDAPESQGPSDRDREAEEAYDDAVEGLAEQTNEESVSGDDWGSDRWWDRLMVHESVGDGSPMIKGTWVTTRQVVSMLVDGQSWREILRSYPELCAADIRACLAFSVEHEGFAPRSLDESFLD